MTSARGQEHITVFAFLASKSTKKALQVPSLYNSQEKLVEERGAKVVLGHEEGKGLHILQMTSIFTLVKLTLSSALISKLVTEF